jgi:hypothetical protein
MIIKTFIIVSVFYFISIFYIFKNVKIDNNIIVIPNKNIIIIIPSIDNSNNIFYSIYTIPYLQIIKYNNISLYFLK